MATSYIDRAPPSVPVVASALQERFIVAAIDFGTTFSGYAYSFYHDFREDPLRITTNHWTSKAAGSWVSCKAPSCILFDKDQQYDSFGYEAEAKYNQLVQNQEHYDWYYFSTFKMLLYKAQEMPLSRKTLLEDSQRKTMCAMDVFTAAIKALKDHLTGSLMEKEKDKLDKGKRKGHRVTADDFSDLIHWVLTVPAIWDDKAKQFMRESAINAEIATGNLTLALEPEAASLFCQYLPSTKVTTDKGVEIECFKSGSKYLVLDAGGGTIDITVHEVEHTKTLKELHKANGGDWGGKKVNEAFEQLFAAILGPDVYEVMQFKHRDDYQELIREIETKKRIVSPTDVGKVNFRLPQSAFETYSDMNKKDLKDQGNVVLQSGEEIRVKIDGDKLRVNAGVIQGLYTETCNNIVAHVREVLSNPDVEGTNTIMLVGGFAESAMLREAIKAEFTQYNVIVPAEAGLAVLKGAVLYGHKPESVISRVSKYTYGIKAYKSFEPGIDPANKRVVVQDYVLCEDHFSKHAEIGKEYTPGQSFGRHEYVPSEPGQTEMMISVYRSTQRYPLYCDQAGSSKVGDMIVELRDKEGGMDRPVVVKMVFGETELGIEAQEKKTGNVTTAKYDFLST